MIFPELDGPIRQIFRGNILLIICCAFYLARWLLAFKPVGAIKGIKSGWLLIPAAVAGVAAVILTVRGIGDAEPARALFPGIYVIVGGIAAYVILVAVTLGLFHRPVTTELILIVGWAVMALCEINVLYGTESLSRTAALVFIGIIVIAMLISLVCYVLYYKLDSRMGYYDGMAPLLMAGLVTAAMTAGILI